MAAEKIIHIYLMPGLAAGSAIFERIHLPEKFHLHFLEWLLPVNPHEPLPDYIDRLIEKITEPEPVLIGVSFGGIIVQEIAKKIATKKVIIISSIKCTDEMPTSLKITKDIRLYKIFPTGIFKDLDKLLKIAFTKTLETKVKLYKKYMNQNNKVYLDWAIKNVLNWNRTEVDSQVIHIHGTEDPIFPIKYLKNYVAVKGASHVLVLSHAIWLNKYLPKFIENNIENINFDENRSS